MVEKSGLVIILGTPGSGKTTLALRLAAELRIPCFCKDDVKEPLFETLGAGDRDWSRKLSRASFAAIIRLAATQLASGPCIIEGNFRAEHVSPLREALERHAAHALQIRCRAEPREILRRFGARGRPAGHHDAALLAELGPEPQPAPYLELPGPRLDYASDQPAARQQIGPRVGDWLNLDIRTAPR